MKARRSSFDAQKSSPCEELIWYGHEENKIIFAWRCRSAMRTKINAYEQNNHYVVPFFEKGIECSPRDFVLLEEQYCLQKNRMRFFCTNAMYCGPIRFAVSAILIIIITKCL